jgi:hypothetical protein
MALQFEGELPQDVRGLLQVLGVFLASALPVIISAPLAQVVVGPA